MVLLYVVTVKDRGQEPGTGVEEQEQRMAGADSWVEGLQYSMSLAFSRHAAAGGQWWQGAGAWIYLMATEHGARDQHASGGEWMEWEDDLPDGW